METRYYTIQDIKKMEGCGKDAAYALAKTLLYEKRGNTIYVFKDSYEEYYKQKLEKAKELQQRKSDNNVYNFRKFS